ncbi:MAG: NUDIX hydrolase, partial [Thermoproteota archaeon]|nr:NUDIX hydrolase [Thermoproteota archaeon]
PYLLLLPQHESGLHSIKNTKGKFFQILFSALTSFLIWYVKFKGTFKKSYWPKEDVKMATYVVVIGVVKLTNNGSNSNDCILLLKRNAQRRTSPNKWQTPSGFINEYESAEEAVLREVKEETALDGIIGRSGAVFEVVDEWARWIIVPFLILVNSEKVVIDTREHSEFRWVKVNEISNFECVKGIDEDLKAVGLKN